MTSTAALGRAWPAILDSPSAKYETGEDQEDDQAAYGRPTHRRLRLSHLRIQVAVPLK